MAPRHSLPRIRVSGSIQTSRNLDRLPCTAEEYHQGNDGNLPFAWNPILKTLLTGTREKVDGNQKPGTTTAASPLTLFRDHESTILRNIYSYLSNEWARHVRMTIPASLVGVARHDVIRYTHGRTARTYDVLQSLPPTSRRLDGYVSFAKCGQVEFPEPTGLNVNMMPFIFGDKDSLPDSLQSYFELIEQCPYRDGDRGKVGYLTVHESYVEAGKTQRRPGLHIEAPGTTLDKNDQNAVGFTPADEHGWGIGLFFGPDHFEGGIYMASSVSRSSQLWDALVDHTVPGIVDRHGGCEHLRCLLGPGTKLAAGDLVWMTDCTPHQALPQKRSGYRQFFRVVTPSISIWYASHSTPNPKVQLPEDVIVTHEDKFRMTT